MPILGIETSCDETAAAVVETDGTIRSSLVLSQLEEHKAFGGVVPEIAARAHLDHLDTLVRGAMEDAGLNFKDLSGIAATSGPGLIGGVIVGMMAGKAIAMAHKLPFIGVNHLEGHILTPRLTDRVEFPYLALLVSGMHTQIVAVEDVGVYKLYGSTLDDALGECFDKAGRLMGLPYPGGPHVERMAGQCTDPEAATRRFPLPTPLKGRKNCDFSFSGLKTAVRMHVDKLPEGDLKAEDVSALCHAFQSTVVAILKDRCAHGIRRFKSEYGTKAGSASFVIVGGVAANTAVRRALEDLTKEEGMVLTVPPAKLCTDNGAMIAWTGIERLQKGLTSPLDMPARPRWPLEEMMDFPATKEAS